MDISKKICNLIFETVSLSDSLEATNKLFELTIEEIKQKLDNITFPAFVFLDEYDSMDAQLRNILKDLFSSNYFSKEWTITVLNLMDWLRVYKNIISPRDYIKFVIDTGNAVSDTCAVISEQDVNPTNPLNSKIVLEVFYKEGDTKKYRYKTRKGDKYINLSEYAEDS